MKTDSTELASSKSIRGHGVSLKYALITPARNEAKSIEETIQSMVAQTARPVKWVIVSDGSTDGTDEIVNKYAAECPWIELLRMPERRERHFAGKVNAFNAGYARLAGLDYDVVGNLDADITMDDGYFDFLLNKFSENPRLGVAGTPFTEGQHQYDYRFTSVEHVSGACQLFRRECFEEIGGYIPIKTGGIDLIAVLSAGTKGWQTRTFLEKTSVHHRPMGTASQDGWRVRFKGGRGDYILGSHPLWECFRCAYQMTRRPFLLGGSVLLAGYLWAMVTRVEKVMPADVIQFRRAQQMRRLKQFIRELFWKSS